MGIIVFCRHIWVRRLLSSERQPSLAAQIQEAQLFMEEVRGLWALGRDAEVGGGGSGAARMAAECAAKHTKLQSHRSPFILIVITVIPTAKPQEQYLSGINMLEWYLRNQPL